MLLETHFFSDLHANKIELRISKLWYFMVVILYKETKPYPNQDNMICDNIY